MNYRLVIFDFDGTLADSLPWFVTVVNDLAGLYGFRSIDAEDLERLRGYSAREAIRHLGIAWWKVPLIAAHVRRRTSRNTGRVSLFPGAAETLRHLRAAGVTLAVVTSNARENVRRILGTENMALVRYFECGVPVFRKRSRFVRVLERSGIPPESALAVGDEIRDLQAAEAAGITFGAVTWGYTSADALRAQQPDAMFGSFEELRAFVERG